MLAWNSPRVQSIFAINLFLGWTLLGWVGAMAVWPDPVQAAKAAKEQEVKRQKWIEHYRKTGLVSGDMRG